MNLSKYILLAQETGSIFRIGFTLSNKPPFHIVYLVTRDTTFIFRHCISAFDGSSLSGVPEHISTQEHGRKQGKNHVFEICPDQVLR